MERKREPIEVNTSKNAKRLDVSGMDGLLIMAVAANVIFFMILFILS